ncbi:carboxymuconolactone decarboxylase family protein [Burkholderia sp. 22PA0099]|uniref:carboxymuconolactone decarboxylase family protein n=1 Tax=Burkholderia sp. 22PA0099 TaxID=3237372 RepID=UPI0039C1D603
MHDTPTPADLGAASPALAHYTATVLDEVWRRPGLAPRDRGIVTVAVLIARNQAAELRGQAPLALDRGVTPAELSEIVAHLAFYGGWGNATAAAGALADTCRERGIGAAQLSPVDTPPLPLDEAAERQRAHTVGENFGTTAPGVVQATTDVLFNDLWLRPGLAPRDRSLVTVAALVANGQVAQIPYHLNRAMDNGLTRDEAAEMLTQLAYYAGWPNVFSAMPVFKEVFAKRAD